MKTMVTLTHEEAQSYLAYALICETMEGAFWNSGRRRRLYSKTFTEAEQRQIPRIKATAHKWCLVTGVPEKGTHEVQHLSAVAETRDVLR